MNKLQPTHSLVENYMVLNHFFLIFLRWIKIYRAFTWQFEGMFTIDVYSKTICLLNVVYWTLYHSAHCIQLYTLSNRKLKRKTMLPLRWIKYYDNLSRISIITEYFIHCFLCDKLAQLCTEILYYQILLLFYSAIYCIQRYLKVVNTLLHFYFSRHINLCLSP